MAALLHPDGLHRCPWPGQDPFYVAYHDDEWGVPERDDRALYEKLMLDGFQAGLSWITILRKRENFRRAFDGFQPAENRALYAEEDRAADAGCRHRAQPAEDRGRGRLGARLARHHGKRSGILEPAVGISSTANPRSIVSARSSRSRRRRRSHERCRRNWPAAASNSSGRRSSMPSCRRPGWSTTTWSTAIVTNIWPAENDRRCGAAQRLPSR